jgi:Leucine-rich repeat (LRR) protein/sugar lactone lactonase YvrE
MKRIVIHLSALCLLFAPINLRGQFQYQKEYSSNALGITQFRQPFGVTVSNDGKIYVADLQHARVVVLDQNTGSLIRSFGSFVSSGDDGMYQPAGVLTDAAGNVYVADQAYNQVKKFSSSGSLLFTLTGITSPTAMAFDQSGRLFVAEYTSSAQVMVYSNTGEFLYSWNAGSYLGGIAIDQNNVVYVSEVFNSQIVKFDTGGGLLGTIGSPGSGNGQFNSPEGLAFDHDGNLYVAERNGTRLQKFANDGTFIRTYTSPPMPFSVPMGIWVDDSDFIYVTDQGNNALYKFANDGTLVFSAGTTSLPGQLYNPRKLSLDANNNLYVAEWSNNRIQKFNTSGTSVLTIGSYGTGDGQFYAPPSVAVAADGTIYAIDNNNRVQVFDAAGNFLFKFGSAGSGNGQFSGPIDMAFDATGNLFVVDQYNNRIQKFSSTGTFLLSFGSAGSADGQFNYPQCLAIDQSGQVYIGENNRGWIQVFDNNGTFIKKITPTGAGQLYNPGALAVDISGTIYVGDWNTDWIDTYDQSGNLISQIGSRGSKPGQFNNIQGITISADRSTLFVSDGNNDRVEVFAGPVAPTITSFTPASAESGATVTLTGTGFNGVSAVSFGGTAASSFTVVSATTITAVVGSGSSGNVSVTTAGGTVSSPGFTFLLSPPTITSFAPAAGPVGTLVTITGSNFSPIASSNVVYFGGAKAIIGSASSTQLTATVPDGATYVPITVTTSGLTAFSSEPFNLTFPGVHTVTGNSLAGAVSFSSGNGTYGSTLFDLDMDGWLDLISTNQGSNTLSIFRNAARSGAITSNSFAPRVDFPTDGSPNSVSVGDLDGDGLGDIVVTCGNAISIFKNTSVSGSLTLASRITIGMPGGPYGVAISDLDQDGKPDLASVNSLGTVSILKNISVTGTLTAGSFAAAVSFGAGSNSQSIAVGDLDGDGKNDLVIANYGSSTLSVFRNIATSGVINSSSFSAKIDLSTPVEPIGVWMADFDGDNKLDLVSSNYSNSTLSFFRNVINSPGSFSTASFSGRLDIPSGSRPYNAAVGDLDGDGQTDIITADYSGTGISVFKNLSTAGNISFQPKVDFVAGSQALGVAMGDIDDDGKPDLTVACNTGSLAVLKNIIPSAQNQSISYVFGDHVVISEVYGGGGNSGANFSNDYVELYNPTGSAVNLSGWSIQYASTTGTFNNQVNLTGSIQPGKYFLIGLAAGGTGGSPLPLPDISGNVNMSAASGKVALCNSTTQLTSTSPTQSTVVDFVGYGTANSFEGTGGTPVLSNTTSAERKASMTSTAASMQVGGSEELSGNGYDSNDNASDFVVRSSPQPQNSTSQETPPILGFTPKSVGDQFTINGIASSGLTINYSSSDPSIASVAGNMITVLAAGTTTITASQSGNASYNAAPDVSQVLTVGKGNQIITFNPLVAKTFGAPPFILTASSSSGLQVSYSSSNTLVAKISGDTVIIVGAGISTITAGQAGDANFNPALVSQTLLVNKANQTITFNSLPIKNFGDPDFSLTASSTSGLLISYTSSNPGVAAINGNNVTLAGPGSTTITASQAGDTNYNPAADVPQSLTVLNPRSVTTSDSLALVDLYMATNGPGWTNSANWLTGPVNTWFGVTIVNQRVTELNFISNNMSGAVPPSIGNLSELVNLQIWANQLTSIPNEIGNLQNLKQFNFGGNPLSGVIPNSLFQLNGLQALDFTSIGLTSLPTAIGNLTNLTSLGMGNNSVTSLPDELTHLTNLQTLSISSNPIPQLPANFAALTNLVSLDISSLPLHHFPAEILSLHNLNHLFAYNIDAGQIPDEIGTLSKLYFVQLFSNNLHSIPSSLGNLSELYWLDVSGNQLDSLPSSIASLPNLQVFVVQSNNLDFGDIEPFLAIPTFIYGLQSNVPGGGPISVNQNSPLHLSFTVGGTANVYQWFKDGNAISGATSNTYTVLSAQPSDAGEYYLQITNTLATALTLETQRYEVTVTQAPMMKVTMGTNVIPNYHPYLFNVDYSLVDVGSGSTLDYGIKNTGSVTLTIDSASVTGTNASEFQLGFPTLPYSLAPGDSIPFTITFTPANNGFRTAKISFRSDDASNDPYAFSLSGTGVNGTRIIQLSGDLAFGAIPIGNTGIKTLAIKNSGNSSLTIQSTQVPANFSTDNIGGVIINAGDSLSLRIYYDPVNGGSDGGYLKLMSDATSGTDSIAVSGSGTSPIAITSVYPSSGKPGDAITIVGSGFSNSSGGAAPPAAPAKGIKVKSNFNVFFDGMLAAVTSVSPDTIIATVPMGASDGRILVFRSPYEALSPQVFKVTNRHPGVFSRTNLASSYVIDSVRSAFNGISVDFDYDGKPDLVTANSQDNTVSFFKNVSTSDSIVFAAPLIIDAGSASPSNVLATDINGNGILDFLISFNEGHFLSTIMDFDYASTVGITSQIDLLAEGASAVAVEDLDRDGLMEIIAATGTGKTLAIVHGIPNSGAAPKTPSSPLIINIGNTIFNVKCIDLDGDGRSEIVLANYDRNGITILQNSSFTGVLDSASLATRFDFPTGPNPLGLDLADVDGDGKTDLIAGNINGFNISVLRNVSTLGNIAFADAQNFPGEPGGNTNTVKVADLSGDGKPEILFGHNASNSVMPVFPNASLPGSIALQSKAEFSMSGFPTGFAVADFNADSLQDVVALSPNLKKLTIFRGRKAPVIMAPTIPASNITFSNVFSTQLKINFTKGNGAKRIVLINPGTPVSFVPSDDTSYSVGQTFGSSKLVMNDTTASVIVSNLQSNTLYYATVYEYNQLGSLVRYLIPGEPTASKATLPLPNVYLTTPPDGAANQAITLNVVAKALTGATTYTIELNDSSNFLGNAFIKSGSRNQNFTGLQYSKRYYTRVKTDLSPDYGQVTSFSTVVPAVTITTPANGAPNEPITLNITSKVLPGATIYTVELSDSANFNGTSIIQSGARTQKFTGLSYATKYYARVKTDIYPYFGPVTFFYTAIPDIFVTTPADGAVDQAISLNVTSKALTGATTYTIELNDSSNFTGTSILLTGARVQKFTGLAYATKYYARVKTDIYPYFGPTTSFTTTVPSIYVTTPADGAVDQAISLNVSSKALTGATTYTIELNDSSDFTGTSFIQSGARTLNFTGLSYAKKYYTRVMTDIYPVFGPATSFTTIVPDVYATSPADGAVNQAITLNITSKALNGATTYIIELNDSANFNGSFSMIKSGSRTQNFSGLSYGRQYFVRVKTDIYPYYGHTTSFSTAPVPFPSITSPVDGAANVSWVLNITASAVPGAKQYTIEVNTDSTFAGAPILKMGSGSSRTMSFTLAKDQLYYVRARTDLDPVWGGVQRFTTGDALSLAYIVSPANHQTDVPTTVDLVANTVPGAKKYTISLSQDSLFSGIMETITSTSRTVSFSNLLQATVYYCRASTDLTSGQWGPITSFATTDPDARTTSTNVRKASDDSTTAESFSVIAYPNPFKDRFQFHAQSQNQEPILVKFMDLNGKILLETGEWTTNSLSEIGGQFAPGIYFLSVQKGNERKVLKVLKVE